MPEPAGREKFPTMRPAHFTPANIGMLIASYVLRGLIQELP